MTIGTGFFGRSSLTSNLQPRDLVQWTQVAYTNDPSEPFGDFTGLEPWTAAPPAPRPVPTLARETDLAVSADEAITREEIRRLIVEELREVVRR